MPRKPHARIDYQTLRMFQREFHRQHRITDSGCLEWVGVINSDGYGMFNVGGDSFFAHRVAWALAHRRDPGKRFVRHTCGNRRCTNPTHLKIGDNARNMRDMIEHDRALKGSRNPNAKLTEADVLAIREAEGIPYHDLADRYGVSRVNISHIRSGRVWKHVGGPRTHGSGVRSESLFAQLLALPPAERSEFQRKHGIAV